MGSKSFFKTAEDFYILGLWLADGYWRSSSIGLTSVNVSLIGRFSRFLDRFIPSHRIKTRIYKPDGVSKRKQTAIQVYINSRPLTRLFMNTKTGSLHIPDRYLPAYLAGRIDGDGHVDTKHRSGIRIAYSNIEDAMRDRMMLGESNTSLYEYKAARTFVLYLKKHYRDRVIPKMRSYSVKIAP